MDTMKFTAYIDGGSRGNPGPAAIGVVMHWNNTGIYEEYSEYIGKATNNVAEYCALYRAVAMAKEYKATHLLIYSDSLLVVNQIKGFYQIKDQTLRKIYDKIIKLLPSFVEFHILHIPREKNAAADGLTRTILDARTTKRKR